MPLVGIEDLHMPYGTESLISYSYTIPLISFFFFSSRRRHTRFDCDWSSDVCSSDLEDEVGVLDVPLRQVAVAQVDPALEVDVVGREVLEADLPVDRRARPPHARDDVAAGADRVGHVRPDLDDAAEVLVPDDEEVVAGRRVAVLGLVDLLVGAVDADAQDL